MARTKKFRCHRLMMRTEIARGSRYLYASVLNEWLNEWIWNEWISLAKPIRESDINKHERKKRTNGLLWMLHPYTVPTSLSMMSVGQTEHVRWVGNSISSYELRLTHWQRQLFVKADTKARPRLEDRQWGTSTCHSAGLTTKQTKQMP